MKEEYEQTVLTEELANSVSEETAVPENKENENTPANDPERVGRAKNKAKPAIKENKTGEEKTEEEAPVEPLSREKAMQVLEAIMFANGEEVYYEQFAKIIGHTTKEAKAIAEDYAKLYDTESFPRGIRIVLYDKCCQLSTLPELGDYVTKMIGIRGEPQLSPAALETLAIIAYNQPVTRPYIDEARRVDSSRSVALLLDRELIEERGRLNVIGHPKLYGTTQNFLKTFGITSLEELPSLDLFPTE